MRMTGKQDKRTKQRLLEELEALQAAKAVYTTLVDKAVEGVIIIQDGLVQFANPSMLGITGFSEKEVLGKPLIDFLKSPYKELVADNYSKRMNGQDAPLSYEVEFTTKDDRNIVLEISGSLITYLGKPASMALVRDVSEHRHMEKQLRRNEEILMIFVEHSPAAIAMFDRDMKYIVASRRYLADYGLTEQSLIGRSHYDVFPEIPERIREVHRRCLSGAVESAKEDEFRRLSGKVDWVYWEMRPWYEPEGGIGGVILFSEVVTERKNAELALRASEERFRTLIENLPLGIAITSQDGKFVMANEALQRMRGYDSREEMVQASLSERYFDRKDRERWLQMIKENGKVNNFEIRLKRKDGNSFWASFDSIAALSTSGEQQFITVIQDITERKMAEETLRLSEEKYRDLVNRINDGIFTTDARMVITFANRALAEIHGYSRPEELMGTSFLDSLVPARKGEIAEKFRQSITMGMPASNMDVSIIKKDGSVAFLQINDVPIIEDGITVGTTGVVRDITEQKIIQGQLIAAGRLAAIGQLAAGIAHEMNNPLTGVIGFSDLLVSRKNLPEDIREDLETVSREAKRAAGIISGLLAFAREQKSERVQLNINAIVQAVLRLRAYEHKVNNIDVEIHPDGGLPNVLGNTGELQQVFLNLIVNAEQAMLGAHKRGRLTVKTEKAGDMVRVSIADDGPGISAENLSRLFTPFFTTKEVGKGTGLGLSICHGIVTGHGGRIYARSESGKGATFFVELPIAQSL